jgi:predicted cupin superfamily sugar epimerase
MNRENAEYYIEKLGMESHYEGGWYKFIWKTNKNIPQCVLGEDYSGDRASASLIYYLLKSGEVSTWHKLRSAEVWFWHAGDSLKMALGGSGESPVKSKEIIIGSNLDKGEQLQAIIPSGIWQTTTPLAGSDFVLVSCVVSPSFHNDDFMLPNKFKEEIKK